MPAPQPTRLFHITALANLQGICATGALVSKNVGTMAGISYQNIAHAGAQGARAQRSVPNPPGGFLHDFVPFYFAPRSPMLYAINGGRVDGCQWRQQDIVYFETTVQAVTQASTEFVFFDRNATLNISTGYTDLSKMDEAIAWDIFTEAPQLDGFCQYWQSKPAILRYADRMERRQAEFLVKNCVALTCVTRLGVIDMDHQSEVRAILKNSGVLLPVDIMREWYF